MKLFNFTDTPPMGKNVKDTAQLKPRTSEEPFARSKNDISAVSRTQHGNLGGLGARSFSDKAK